MLVKHGWDVDASVDKLFGSDQRPLKSSVHDPPHTVCPVCLEAVVAEPDGGGPSSGPSGPPPAPQTVVFTCGAGMHTECAATYADQCVKAMAAHQSGLAGGTISCPYCVQPPSAAGRRPEPPGFLRQQLVRGLLPPHDHALYLKLRAEQLPRHQRHCPGAECDRIVSLAASAAETSTVACGYCDLRFCFACRSREHAPALCEQAQCWARLSDELAAFTADADATVEAWRRCALLHALVSHVGWAAWSVFQAAGSQLADFDYVAYARQRWAQYERQRAEFDALQ